MADPSQLSRRERQIMEVVFAHGQATVTTVLQEMPDAPTRDAVRAFLRILEEKGHLTRHKEGREFVFRPTQPRGRAGRNALRRVLDVFFEGSVGKALAAHMADGKLSPEDVKRLGELVEKARKEGV